MTTAQTIYFDESGFTGNNLLNRDQPVFTYASVAIDSPDAARLHAEMVSRCRIKGNELKGKRLVQSSCGREAISWLLAECRDIACITTANKNFALAAKFFEYVFEPVLKPQNSLFYAVGFHRFIANLLYVLFESKGRRARHVLDNFEVLMRTQELSFLEQLITPEGKGISFSDPLDQILTFGLCHIDKIKDEIKNLSQIDRVSRWALELTATSLFWLLSFWSERFDSMEVYCDKSRPLDENRSVFDAMIGRTDRIYMKLGNQPERALTFNLAGPIVLVDSKESPGIQIADVLSSSIAFALKNPEEESSKKWLELADGMFSTTCILPDLEEINLQKRDPVINGLILLELVTRTLDNRSLFIDMPEFILARRRYYEISPPVYSED